MNIAIIPARGGSKRIPRKNIKNFHGKPIIAYSIEAAIQSGVFDRVIVSTDDSEISEIAREYGAEVPFIRPQELSCDHTATVPVIKHAIEEIEQQMGVIIGNACCIYATAPFVDERDIKRAKEMLDSYDINYVVPVSDFDYPIQRALSCDNNIIKMIEPEYIWVRSQDLPETFHDIGQFYWGVKSAWINEKPLLSSEAMCIKVDRSKVQDIDTEDDWRRAELIFRYLQEIE